LRLQEAPLEHAEAVLAAYEVLQGLHDSGALEILRGALGGGGKILEQVIAVGSGAQSIRATRNLLLLVTALGEIEPALLGDLTRAIPKALVQANAEEAKATDGLGDGKATKADDAASDTAASQQPIVSEQPAPPWVVGRHGTRGRMVNAWPSDNRTDPRHRTGSSPRCCSVIHGRSAAMYWRANATGRMGDVSSAHSSPRSPYTSVPDT